MIRSIAEMTGAEFPLFAFSHCRDVVAAVSRAGGLGVLGGSSFTPESLEEELRWIDANVDVKPYGIDILIPENIDVQRGVTGAALAERIPIQHRKFAADLLRSHGIDATEDDVVSAELPAIAPEIGESLMDVAFRHPIRLIANALGIAPSSMIERARAHGVPVAALVGAKEHAIRQVRAGVDIIVAQGTEAGGHCGEVSTLVLIPEVVRALRDYGSPPVLAAGGIVTGEQMAACMAMGAAGAWTGSVWRPPLSRKRARQSAKRSSPLRHVIRSGQSIGRASHRASLSPHGPTRGRERTVPASLGCR
ncbi:NAD(P)H-dependent flavin oxidoreductase YrpB (nitropropane dioxygenase family) [Novosphingobium hassiacum]|uniref:NAD(P)H-dependent flavin oxidoreductase YrpB (Nitropropane dioxygenase family) n=1 Tax=Novosphingobium hassiacum TaxID=173676 RepID=A0A7W5ZZ17_9SPHN|nr:nitronate monooxygenase [Novosphingobium hassiacum]MBB3862656.1 NAD(P)H-dependent flavin oxidoreductase YrpB (nitropropane dioxygenase family) [Novosphingobium hassiacum]